MLKNTHFSKVHEPNTEYEQLVGMRLRRALADESMAITFFRPRQQMLSPQWNHFFKCLKWFIMIPWADS